MAELIGLEHVLGTIEKEVQAIKNRSYNAVKLAGQAYANDVKVLAPYQTGDYRRSIHVEMQNELGDVGLSLSGDLNPVAWIGTDKPQACRLEFGYWGMIDSLGRLYYQYPRPHFRPPLDTQIAKYVDIMQGSLAAGSFGDYRIEKREMWSDMESAAANIRPDLLSMAGSDIGWENWL